MKTIKGIPVATALVLAACGFDVTNPGPVPDEVLDDPGAYASIVRGVQFNLSRAVSIDAYYGAVAAKEYSTSGRVIATKLPLAFGQLTVDDMAGGAGTWNWSHSARWQAENGVERLRRVLGADFATNRFAGQLLMYAALSNRVLGENMCEAVIDGGPAQPNTVHLTRAETLATEAIDVATAANDVATANAARAVRASVRLYLGKFAEAAIDAAAVPTSFVLSAPFDEQLRNIIVESNDFMLSGSTGFRAHTVWRTFFENYYRTTGDPRTQWDSLTSPATARFGEFTNILWDFQRKYTAYGSAIRLASGREMRLVEAEVALRNNDVTTAMTLINGIRTAVNSRFNGQPLQPWTASTVPEAWDALKRERSIELWLEARTMGDLRRWIADGTYPSMFTIGPENDVANRIRLCLPITRGERQTNPNLSRTPNDPTNPIFDGSVAPW
ncbi:MAG TPA: RagB/SusD family nutrient uptake outer membrane protein [Gemmatimonadales bacterium]|jgi:hypothetical protein|nr:RagB/SusD family nutrient uptake outer membrane protein [Gemmatimonadales bacterium]